MCGLAGVIDLKGRREPDRAQVARMGAALTHRGPDETGTLFAPGIGAIQQRLSIVGLGNGQQPIFNEDRTVAVICNGELFDYPERKAELQARGHVFRGGSDCELIVHLYEEHGEDLFPQLKGQFAFVLFDFARRIVLLARDRVGICPLHWSRQGDCLLLRIGDQGAARLGRRAGRGRCAGARSSLHLLCARHAPHAVRRRAVDPAGPLSQDRIPAGRWRRRDRGAALLGFRFPRPGSRAGCRRPNGADRRVRGDVPARRRDQAPRRRAGGRLSERRRRFGLRARHSLQDRRAAAAELHHSGAGCRARRGGACARIVEPYRRRGDGGRGRGERHRRQLCGADPRRGVPGARHLLRRAARAVAQRACAGLQGRAHRRGRRRGVRRLCVVQDQGGRAQPRYWRLPSEHGDQPACAQGCRAKLELRRVRAHRRHDRRTACAVHHVQSRGDVARPLLQRRAEGAAGVVRRL